MAVKRVRSNLDVVTAARQRIKNVFANGVPVYLSFSGGKDSLVLADLVYKLLQAGEIDPAQLTVLFIDEEAIFDCIEETTKTWRKKFLLAGAKFQSTGTGAQHAASREQLTRGGALRSSTLTASMSSPATRPLSAGTGVSGTCGCASRPPSPSATTLCSSPGWTTTNPSCPASPGTGLC